jgi:hypothetical protein
MLRPDNRAFIISKWLAFDLQPAYANDQVIDFAAGLRAGDSLLRSLASTTLYDYFVIIRRKQLS